DQRLSDGYKVVVIQQGPYQVSARLRRGRAVLATPGSERLATGSDLIIGGRETDQRHERQTDEGIFIGDSIARRRSIARRLADSLSDRKDRVEHQAAIG